jgi:hypothetical protein
LSILKTGKASAMSMNVVFSWMSWRVFEDSSP